MQAGSLDVQLFSPTRRISGADRVPVICSIFCVAFAASPLAMGAQYQFVLKGQVTTSFFPDVSVGDTFAIRYLADSQDTSADPAIGTYSATNATMTFPNRTITTFGLVAPLSVLLNASDGTDRVSYLTLGNNESLSIAITFAGGTLTSDALPLTLPIGSATAASFQYYFFNPVISGEIESYDSVEVPEPVSLVLLASLTCMLRPRKTTIALHFETDKGDIPAFC